MNIYKKKLKKLKCLNVNISKRVKLYNL